MADSPQVFDRKALRRQRQRHAAALAGGADFLIREVAERLVERLGAMRRRFPQVLDLGCHGGQLARALRGAAGTGMPVQADLALHQVARASGLRVVCDEELLPFAEGRFDAVLSAFSLHWVNDLPGTLVQIRRALRPDGLLLAAMAGGQTLFELREALLAAELETTGGAGARVSPFADVRDAGGLLQRAGFALPVVDCDRITVTYEHPLALMAELRRMGEASVLQDRPRRPLARAALARACALYQERHADAQGRVPATFDILFLAGWTPHAAQQQALRPGSGRTSLARLFGERR